ncbi:hypothetical protein SHKM778_46190 [Streptomyces sp. KM77-8]|uniref:Mycothiol-dependent maleylpyruvate isomerase metal-binding domain-containing protein n=1 Tax=Streptomyces haneummycinicus TaxID=3074435 RepID=A0AAT9HLM5_9ACTN
MSDRPRDSADMAVLIADVAFPGERFVSALSALADADIHTSSALPAWPRGHVASHVARSADAYVRPLTAARTGSRRFPRADATLDGPCRPCCSEMTVRPDRPGPAAGAGEPGSCSPTGPAGTSRRSESLSGGRLATP